MAHSYQQPTALEEARRLSLGWLEEHERELLAG